MQFKKYPIKYQTRLQDCATTCLEMIADYFGKPCDPKSLYEQCNVEESGASVLELGNAAKKIGFKTLAIKCTMDDLRNDIPLPAIIFWKTHHFIVAFAKDDEYIFVSDPAVGRILYKHEEFEKGWYLTNEKCGVLLAVEPSDSSYLV